MMRQGDIFSCSSTNEDFEVGAELGRGGFGIVYKKNDRKINQGNINKTKQRDER